MADSRDPFAGTPYEGLGESLPPAMTPRRETWLGIDAESVPGVLPSIPSFTVERPVKRAINAATGAFDRVGLVVSDVARAFDRFTSLVLKATRHVGVWSMIWRDCPSSGTSSFKVRARHLGRTWDGEVEVNVARIVEPEFALAVARSISAEIEKGRL